MPIYEYDCPHCGDFTMLRPMAERDTPCACPYCETESARVILSAPGLATMPGSQRRAIETNERSRHAPQTLEEYKANRKHPAGCSCCGPSKPVERTKANPHGLKASPSARPWMISHRGCLLGSRQRGDDVGHGHHLSTVIPAQAGTQRHSAAALPGTT